MLFLEKGGFDNLVQAAQSVADSTIRFKNVTYANCCTFFNKEEEKTYGAMVFTTEPGVLEEIKTDNELQPEYPGLDALIYTTRKCVSVLVPFDEPVNDEKEYKEKVSSIIDSFKLDRRYIAEKSYDMKAFTFQPLNMEGFTFNYCQTKKPEKSESETGDESVLDFLSDDVLDLTMFDEMEEEKEEETKEEEKKEEMAEGMPEEKDPDEWKKELEYTNDGRLKSLTDNYVLIMRNDEEIKNLLPVRDVINGGVEEDGKVALGDR